MTPIKGKIKRSIKLHSVQSPVAMVIAEDGLYFSMPKAKKKLFASWEMIVRATQTPEDIPSYLAGKPMEFLRWQLERVSKGGVQNAAL